MNKFRIEFRWAIYYTFLSILWFQLEKSLGFHDQNIDNQPYITNLFYVIIFIIYIFALIDKKKNYFKGVMTWQQGLISGVVLSVLAMILSPFAIYFKLKYINPNFFEQMIKASISRGIKLENAEALFNMKSYITLGVVDCLSFGIIFAALASAITKSKNIK